MSFLPSPLHPMVVHLPIALTLLVPLCAVGTLWVIHRGARPSRTWALTVGLLSMLLLSGWAALATGEAEEDVVESVVADQAIETHEEAAQAFLVMAGAVLLLSAGGLLAGRAGRAARMLATAGSLALVGAGWQVGHTGGQLVYRENAGAAYAARPAGTSASQDRGAIQRGDGRRADDDRR